ncbi:MAG TPA: IS110 family transposase [Mariprofundaceae bacterium]|nr:IS110 family transposase [Mariprofundaceae bacterium]
MKYNSAKDEIKVVGIDLAKSVFHVHGVDEHGRVAVRKRMGRNKLAAFMVQLPPCLVGMEACGGSNDWARKLAAMGHDVRLISPQFVKPYVKSNKNDMADAAAICEAVSRPNMRFVPIKSVEQQDIQSLHRARSLAVSHRTAQANQTRGLLMEYGIVVAKSIAALRKGIPEILEDADNALSPMFRELLCGLWDEFLRLDARVAGYDAQIKYLSEQSDVCTRLMTIPGIGPMVSTALVAAVADGKSFKSGDVYLRKLLIHGARAALRWADRKHDRRSRWVSELKDRRGQNIAAVALANKTVRTAWVLMTRNEEYRTASATV